jgi:hypothetical protein
MTPPASRMRAAAGPSDAATGASNFAAVPDGWRKPATATFSFTVVGTPSMAPAGAPAAQRASLSRAAAIAPASSMT